MPLTYLYYCRTNGLADRKLFALRRRQQTDALIAISKFKAYTKQYKMAEAMIQKIFEVLFESKAVIIDTGYIPEMAFPKDEKIRDAISKIYENTAFFGEIALRLPDITHKIYDRKTEWRYAIHWSVGFCNDSVSIFHGPHKKLLNLMSQELKLIPRDANYVNPYSKKENDREKMVISS
ncbi:uncharacterized protein TRIADDRAFT_31801 [Trichoplax adhaerens]|uniref:Coiled-coil domain-containing protein 134 n=1 Tax=Trichoplax adhaerens TaxID=10228 RepID=B3S9U2_TRIAD|nr:hypothetical protein TRIADDRAFT_31801 [Trichoplax adhaerens]EDV20531.1 hypothetical protein TRIADDRAFT_31801 [Trichoplax adhaerens]|eukprot:XP_002116957.1 hypothetical protein TRIADDRAFT_31801 [Trichoplax adhaerens]